MSTVYYRCNKTESNHYAHCNPPIITDDEVIPESPKSLQKFHIDVTLDAPSYHACCAARQPVSTQLQQLG
jgi:hypothetical protein